MKNLIYIITTLILLYSIHSQSWEQVATPFDYEGVNYLSSMNGEVYISKYDWVDSTIYNYQYSNNEWINAIDDDIYNEFGYLYNTDQFDNRILVSSLNGVYLSDDYG